MITEKNCIIDRFSAMFWLETDMKNKYSANRMMKEIILMLLDDPDGAQNTLIDCIIANEDYKLKRLDRERKQSALDDIEDAKFA